MNIPQAKTLKTFESRLDKFWSDQDIKYNFKATVVTGHNLDYEDEELVPQDEILLPESSMYLCMYVRLGLRPLTPVNILLGSKKNVLNYQSLNFMINC